MGGAGSLQPNWPLTWPVCLFLSLPTLFLSNLPPPWRWLTDSEFSPPCAPFSLLPERCWGIFRLRRGPGLLPPLLMSFFPVNSGSPEFYPPGQKEGWPTFILRSLAPRGMPCPSAPISRGHGDGYSLGALLLPLAKQSPCMAGAEVTLSVAFWAVDMCVFRLMLPITSLLSARLSLLLSVSAPEPSDALPHTGRPGPLLPLREGITGLAGLVSCHFIQPQDPLCRCREYRELCLTQPEFRASEQGEAEARQLFPNPSPGICHCTSQGPRTVAVIRLARG